MDLKFSFGGASPDHHDHGGAPSGVSLPLTAKPVSLGPASSSLDIVLRRTGATLVAEAVSGDGVTYARAEVDTAPEPAPEALAKAARSAISRAVAELEGPMSESVTAVVVDLGTDSVALITALGINLADPVVDAALQRRSGIAMGTPVRVAD
ncbi:hypothetical protein [Leucobacter chromiireducens]|uniref:Uncharacterized protein n=1 Tax=Leucobacter chromiireducens subsp. solipictus TaxID=398235 RepID=A0ABS1SJL5_9MICO|nr:hypothetical protein [Leucobacter chromiireducens]MBL3680071.1 hypothetical protein [Leucobacter chromiireducens subsp. solipictus]